LISKRSEKNHGNFETNYNMHFLRVILDTKSCKSHLANKSHHILRHVLQGIDCFAAKVNIEVQRTSELVIAAIERNGGSITTKFYDIECVRAMSNPLRFFGMGRPIPRCMLPAEDAVDYYSDAKNRGYLADPAKIQEARFELAQKYGYELPDLSKDPDCDMLMLRKDPRQIWFGLEPGWVVNLKDKEILKPSDEEFKDYYKS
jgi:large subunit ribosomal protein L15